MLEWAAGLEPAPSAWKAEVQPVTPRPLDHVFEGSNRTLYRYSVGKVLVAEPRVELGSQGLMRPRRDRPSRNMWRWDSTPAGK